ncbi:MAG: tetratricopeptide repeat protein [Tannerella sp.]|jgi:tetratricopeptide (TPR) repeat protein|nr:tetratricopeptide repeat protein [Tannerella sp.]
MKYKLAQVILIGVFVYIAAISFSCSDKTDRTERLLERAEHMMQNHPDSALRLLDGVIYPEIYKYLLLMVQAKDKNYKDITGDTIIGRAVEYYIKTGDSHNAALARFYQGRIRMYKGDYKGAIQELLFAEELAKKEGHYNLLGLINDDIGTIYRKQLNYDKCIEHYSLLARDYFSKAGNKKNENVIISKIGNLYLRMEPPQTEKALSLYDQSLEYAVREKDTMQMLTCLSNISVAYRDIGDYDNAKKYIEESILLDKKNEFIFKNYNNLVKIYLAVDDLDSAIYYLNSISGIIEKSQNNHDLFNYNLLFYSVYESKGDYQTALNYYKKSQEYLNLIYDESNEKSILEIQEKYNKTKVEKFI